MAHAVADAIDGKGHLLVQAGTGTGKSLAYLVPAVQHAMDTRHAHRRRHRDAGAAGADRRPRHAAAGRLARAAARPPPDLRAGQGAAQLPVRAQARGRFSRRRRRHADVGRGRRPAGLAAGRRGRAAARLGRGHRVRRPRRAGAGGVGAGLAAGLGVGPRVPRAAAARWCRSASSSARARRRATSTSSSPTTRSWPSTRSRAAQMLPEHDVLVVDEGHELVDRVTSTITDEVTPGMVAGRSAAGGAAGRLELDDGRRRRPARVGARAGRPRGG